MNETLFGADRDRTISANHCFYLFSKNDFLSIYVKMYVKDFATPLFFACSGEKSPYRISGFVFLFQIPEQDKIEKTVPFHNL